MEDKIALPLADGLRRQSRTSLRSAAVVTILLVLLTTIVGCTRLPPSSGQTPGPLASPSLPVANDHDLYVSPTGSDKAKGSRDDPLATVDAALDQVVSDATIWLLPGVHEPFSVDGKTAGRKQRPITIAGSVEGAAVITGGDASAAVTIVDTADVTLVDLSIEGPAGRERAGIRIDDSHDIRLEGSTIQGVRGGFGVEVRYSWDVTITANDIGHNAVAVRLFGDGEPGSVHDVVIEGNWLHDSDSMVVNDAAPDNDTGGNGISWSKISGRTVARNNQVWNNRAASHDYGTDGGAFEIWGSSNMEISGNTAWNNVNVLETGTDGPDCRGIQFVRNTAYATDRSGTGLILRCAQDGLFAHNVLDGFDGFGFELTDGGGGNRFASSVDGVRIVDNIIVGSPAYSIPTELDGTVAIDRNVLWNPAGPIAKLPNRQRPTSLPELTAATGYDAGSVQADPLFVNGPAHDYHLGPGSPAIDLGLELGDEPFAGLAPDAGPFELTPASPAPS